MHLEGIASGLDRIKIIRERGAPTSPERSLDLSKYLVRFSPSSSFVVVLFLSSKMAEFEDPSLSYEETKYRARVELHDLSEECLIERKYMGTDSDRHDMIMLGRKQVLRVRTNMARPS